MRGNKYQSTLEGINNDKLTKRRFIRGFMYRYLGLLPFVSILMILVIMRVNDGRKDADSEENAFLKEEITFVEEEFTYEIDESINTTKFISYVPVVYIDGYSYAPMTIYSYDFWQEDNYENIKGSKLGEVSLDLKGKRYTGTPPDFSGTLDVGTEIYEIRNVKMERAVIVQSENYQSIFYREKRYLSSNEDIIGLHVSDVFTMLSNQPIIECLEFRSSEDGSWNGVSTDQNVIALLNEEILEQELSNNPEMGWDSNNLKFNLIFKDGSALNIVFFPNKNIAYLFGGYITISEKLGAEIKRVYYSDENLWIRITDLIPVKEYQINYIQLIDHISEKTITQDNNEWPVSVLYSMLHYYRAVEKRIEVDELGDPVMSVWIGKNPEDSTLIEFYDYKNLYMIIMIDEVPYSTVVGHIKYHYLLSIIKYFEDELSWGIED